MQSVIVSINLLLGVSVPTIAADIPTTDFYCYMVERDGRLVNLEELCIKPEAADEPSPGTSFGQGDLPISCDFQPEPEGVDQTSEALSLAIPFTCEAEGDIAPSNMTLRLVLNGEASGAPLSQSVPALAEGETYDSVATFTVTDPPENPNSVVVEYLIQEGDGADAESDQPATQEATTQENE
ncbi:MAG: hypothetical protein AAGE59_11015 [Cyanobacteria bacterium P01_F01_bin.86]